MKNGERRSSAGLGPSGGGMQNPWEIDQTIYDTEGALLAGVRRGDRLACTCLLQRFMPRLYQLAQAS